MQLEREVGGRIELCVIERRGRSVWLRRGFTGGQGKLRALDLPDEPAAQAQAAREIAARIAEGFVVVHEHTTVSAPFRSRAKATPRKLSPREIGRAIARALPPLPAPFATILDAIVTGAQQPANLRLARIELDGSEREADVDVTLAYASGRGDNVDDYDFEGFRLTLRLAAPWPGESDGVLLDVFADELRIAAVALVKRFHRAVRDLPAWRELEDCRVLAVDFADLDAP